MSSQKAISLSNLQFSWGQQVENLLDLESVEVAAGSRLFLCGSSGSGKSTLLNLIGGVLTPNSGELTVLGQPLHAMNSAQRDRFRGDHMGFIFQMFNLIPYLSVIENVLLPCRFSSIKSRKIRDRGATPEGEALRLLDHLKLDVKRLKSRSVIELSVGQQQRVATARALMGSPELVIADEPTSALDADTRDAFVDLLFNECEEAGSTLVFVSHDAELGQRFDRVEHLSKINRAWSEPDE